MMQEVPLSRTGSPPPPKLDPPPLARVRSRILKSRPSSTESEEDVNDEEDAQHEASEQIAMALLANQQQSTSPLFQHMMPPVATPPGRMLNDLIEVHTWRPGTLCRVLRPPDEDIVVLFTMKPAFLCGCCWRGFEHLPLADFSTVEVLEADWTGEQLLYRVRVVSARGPRANRVNGAIGSIRGVCLDALASSTPTIPLDEVHQYPLTHRRASVVEEDRGDDAIRLGAAAGDDRASAAVASRILQALDANVVEEEDEDEDDDDDDDDQEATASTRDDDDDNIFSNSSKFISEMMVDIATSLSHAADRARATLTTHDDDDEEEEEEEEEKAVAAEDTTATLRAVPSFSDLQVPQGKVEREHLHEIHHLAQQGARDITYATICSRLYQQHRKLSGQILWPFMSPLLDQLCDVPRVSKERLEWCALLRTIFQHLDYLESRGDRLTFHFTFSKTKMVTVPSSKHWTMHARLTEDPFRVDKRNVVRRVTLEPRNFILSKRIRFDMHEHGIVKVVEGDLVYHAAMFLKFNTSIRTFVEKGRVELHDDGRPYLEEDDHGQPLVIDGHYVPRRYDYWVVISVLGRETWIGLPQW